MSDKLKRLISVMVTVCLTAGIFMTEIPASAASTAEQTDTFELQKKLLEDIGILKFDIEDNQTALSRGQFADMAMRSYLKEWPSYDKAETFSDVIPNYEFRDALEAGYSCNIIRGVGEDVFGVDMAITPAAAVTIMLRVLNYEKYIESYGSFEDNYIRIAGEIGLVKKLDLTKEQLCFKDAVQLLYNAIDIAPLSLTEYSNGTGTYERTYDSTLIYERLGIEQTEGVLTANCYTDLEGGNSLGEGNVRIDGIVYGTGTTDADEFIGYNVHIYYDEESRTVLHIEDDDSDLTEIDASDDSIYSNGVLTYWTENNRRKSTKIDTSSVVVYNDKLVRSGQFDESLFDLDVGTITVIEKSFDGHTVVIIRSYKDMVLDRCVQDDDTCILVNKFDSDNNIVIDETDIFDIRDEKGTKLKAADIPAEAVISAAVSLDGSSGRLIANTNANKLTQAYVLSAGQSSAKLKTYVEAIHTYEEAEYKYTKYFEKKNKEENIVSPGVEYTAYIDVFGLVAYMSGGTDMSDFYAYIIKVFPDDSDPEAALTMRAFCDNGKVKEYEFAENIVIDGVNCKKKSNDDIIALLGINSETKSRLSYISLTYDSMVKSIDTCLDETDEREADYSLYKSQREASDTLYKIDGSTATYASSIPGRRRYSSETKSFDSGILISSSTKILAIPRDSDDPSRFKVITSGSFLNDRCYNVKAYGRDDDTIAPDVLLYYYYSRYSPDSAAGEVTGSNIYACLPFERTYDTETGIVTDCSEAVNPDTGDVETIVKITNIRSGAETVYYTDDEALTEGISSGQLVRYFVVGGSLCYLEKLYSITDKAFNENIRTIKWVNGQTSVPSYFITHDGTYLADSYSASASENPVYGIARGVIMNRNTSHLAYITYDNYEKGNTEEKYWKYYTFSAIKVYKYNERSNSLEIKNFSDLISYNDSSIVNSEVVIVTKNKAVMGIIIY